MRLDGANSLQRFFRITLPLLSPTMLFVTVIDMISSFQVFDTVYVITNGGPGYSTPVITFTIYQHAFQFLQIGYASALVGDPVRDHLDHHRDAFLYFRKRLVYDLS